MKRKPTPKTLRAGQTVYFLVRPAHFLDDQVRVGHMIVGSDKQTGVRSLQGPFPRWAVARHFQAFPGDVSYSRRRIERLAKERTAELQRNRRALEAAFARFQAEAHTLTSLLVPLKVAA